MINSSITVQQQPTRSFDSDSLSSFILYTVNSNIGKESYTIVIIMARFLRCKFILAFHKDLNSVLTSFTDLHALPDDVLVP